jgi:hypothetical protein
MSVDPWCPSLLARARGLTVRWSRICHRCRRTGRPMPHAGSLNRLGAQSARLRAVSARRQRGIRRWRAPGRPGRRSRGQAPRLLFGVPTELARVQHQATQAQRQARPGGWLTVEVTFRSCGAAPTVCSSKKAQSICGPRFFRGLGPWMLACGRSQGRCLCETKRSLFTGSRPAPLWVDHRVRRRMVAGRAWGGPRKPCV